MNQKEKIIQMMASGLYVCSRDFLGAYLPEYRSLINKLRKEGYEIEDKRCDMHVHEGRMNMWRLTKLPDNQPNHACCFSYSKFKTHDSQCAYKIRQETTTNSLF